MGLHYRGMAPNPPCRCTAVKFLGFLTICVLVGFIPGFVHMDRMHGWLIDHHPREFRRVYAMESYYESVSEDPDYPRVPRYQPLLVNTFLLIIYASVVYGASLAVVRRIRGRSKTSPATDPPGLTQDPPPVD